jgi:hypothetical protein
MIQLLAFITSIFLNILLSFEQIYILYFHNSYEFVLIFNYLFINQNIIYKSKDNLYNH